ncbi:tetratricopeptide repeat protein [Streptomyces sp. NPDC048172]|uniref:tetratricopeptide repeat protein n=1 Tax=Streptomyces sp. NPDC048172 TaxID=3365505 RepID=UPI00371F3161
MGAEREPEREGGAGGATENAVSGGRAESVLMGRDFLGPVTVTTAGGRRVPAYLQDPGRWPVAGGWGALAAGAHRARPDRNGDAVPPYVVRDTDGELRERLAAAARDGGFVLLVGESTAGKTRAAFEALAAVLPGYRVLAPAKGEDLPLGLEVAEQGGVRCVVWLDDVERYLGPEGLEPGLLAELERLRVPVLATMRHQQYETFTAAQEGARGGGGPHAEAMDVGARVLKQVEPVAIERVWSRGELARAEESDDERIADALTHHGPYGIAEYLAAGPVLLREWQRAARPGGHPRAAALVAAAVDLARTGLRPPFPRALLAEAHEAYLRAAGGPLLRPEPLDDAVEWACRHRHGVTSMLVPTEDPDAWDVFDYLVDHARTDVPEATWHLALRHTADAEECSAIAVHARRAASPVAEAAYRQAVDAGSTGAMNGLGVLLATAGRLEEAEALFRRAVEEGGERETRAVFNLGVLHREAGRAEEAEAAYRRAAEAGHSKAMNNLGTLLRQAGRLDEAEDLFRRAAREGHAKSHYNLGNLLRRAGRLEEAEAAFREAAADGHAKAQLNLGVLLRRTGRTEEAELFLRRAALSGDPKALDSLTALLRETGRADEPEDWGSEGEPEGPS